MTRRRAKDSKRLSEDCVRLPREKGDCKNGMGIYSCSYVVITIHHAAQVLVIPLYPAISMNILQQDRDLLHSSRVTNSNNQDGNDAGDDVPGCHIMTSTTRKHVHNRPRYMPSSFNEMSLP